jgi:uncharacterized protein
MPATRFLYLHGFASGPRSKKGLAFASHFAPRAARIELLDLRLPSLEHLRLSAMIDAVRAQLAPDDRAVLIGSSLGGLAAARIAERDPRIVALVLLAPAFELVSRWRAQLGEAAWASWQATGFREVTDHATGRPARVDFGFVEDVARVDRGFPALPVDALVLHGVSDDVVPIDSSRRFVAARPRARLIELDDDHELLATLPRSLAETEAVLAAHG